MAHDSRLIFAEVDKRLSLNPAMRLGELTREIGYSHPTIEKAVKTHAGLSFRRYQQQKRLEAARRMEQLGYSAKYIGISLGYRWPGNYARFAAHAGSDSPSTGCAEEPNEESIQKSENFLK